MAQITYENKVKISDSSLPAVNKVRDVDMNEIKNVVNENYNETNQRLLNIGKLLWTGSFTSGSITVDGLSNYKFIIVMLSSIPCIGTPSRGIGGIGSYASLSISHYAYRFRYTDGVDTLTIDSENRGGTDGSTNQAVTQIYGLF